MEIYLNDNQDKIKIDLEYWEKFISKLLNLLKQKDNTEISITFVDNEEIKSLNKNYRKIDKATDVLSFPFDNSFNLPINVLGDIVISTEKAQIQAEEYGNTLEREIGFLLIHGMLHLLGYDHQTEEEEKEMFGLQKELIKEFSF
ncbi:MAG: rRNA maturation RNase YbeY [Candidatus Sericytochromatia bacterium]